MTLVGSMPDYLKSGILARIQIPRGMDESQTQEAEDMVDRYVTIIHFA